MTTTDTEAGWATTDAPSIYVLMGRVLAELPAIGKNQVNTEQRFNFRGYDDVLNGLNPVMSKHGVFIVPRVLERVTDRRSTRSGGVMYEVNLHVSYRFYGPAGDYVEADGWGEGTDMGDKATNKAMTNALKYVLFQAFAISTEEVHLQESDRGTPEESVPDTVECRSCGKGIAGARTDREPMRVHVIEDHGWVRQDDGTVLNPAANAKRLVDLSAQTAAVGEESQDPAPDEAQAGPPPAPPEPTPAPEPVAEPKPKKAAAKKATPAPAPTPEPEPEPEPTLPLEPEPTPAVTEADPEPDGGQDDAGWQCPGVEPDACTEPPFATEEEYHAHWFEVHDPTPTTDPEDTPQAAADAPVAPAGPGVTIPNVKARISSLTGADARAYGAYRREHGLPRPDEMSEEQATALLAFLDELAAKG